MQQAVCASGLPWAAVSGALDAYFSVGRFSNRRDGHATLRLELSRQSIDNAFVVKGTHPDV